jgi:regulator of sirC expression with transglutaminase-like and TPR domain
LNNNPIVWHNESSNSMSALYSETEIITPNFPELDALFRLLDDPDTEVSQAIQSKFLEYGGKIVPDLRSLLDNDPSVFTRRNCEQIIQTFQLRALNELKQSIIIARLSDSDIDLEKSVMLLSEFGYPETNPAEISLRLDEIALDAHQSFIRNSSTNELTLLMSLNDAFFEHAGFRGATPEYKPEHSYFHTLFTGKKGIPISLSAAYILAAQRVGIELEGIGMPLHFIVYHPILHVFIDVFNFGVFISREDCKHFISRSNFDYNDSMLEKIPNTAILIRMIRNLIYAHSRKNEHWESDALKAALDEILK